MDGRRTCKGCGTVVVKPIVCSSCDIASHPACIHRTGHPHSRGQFVDCSDLSVTDLSVPDLSVPGMSIPAPFNSGSLLLEVQQLFREEFAAFRKEMRELYRADMAKLRGDIQCLSNRVEVLESVINGFQPPVSSQVLEEDIIEEINEREKRSANLIFFNLEESEEGSGGDTELVNEIISGIRPGIVPAGTRRLGKKRLGHSRPVCVSMSNKREANLILSNKTRYSGPVRIFQDQTLKQRNYLKELRTNLQLLKDSGVRDKTIRFVNGVPKIVDFKPRSPKN